MKEEAPAALLSYGFSTSPAPLQVSTQLTAARGRVNIGVLNPKGAYCDQIGVALHVGSEPASFGVNPPSASLSTARWTISDLEVADQQARYFFKCRDRADWRIAYDLVLGLAGVLNQAPGQLQLLLSEHSGMDPDKLAWSQPATILLDKLTPRFYLQNLVAVAPGAPTQPVTEFAAGAPIRLEWESNGTWFEVYAKGSAKPVDAGGAKPVYAGSAPHCDLPGIQTDTTFFLTGRVTGDPTGDQPSAGYQTISLYESITLTVSNPKLAASSLATTGDAQVGGKLDVTGEMSGGSVRTTGSVLGDLVVATSAIGTPGKVSGGTVTAGGSVYAKVVHAQLDVPTSLPGAVTGLSKLAPTGWMIPTPGGWFEYQHDAMPAPITTKVSLLVHEPAGDHRFGVYTNGLIYSTHRPALVAQLDTSEGPRTVAAPLCAEPEIHLSGHGRLQGGRAVVELDAAVADMVLHAEGRSYRVTVTPTALCNGLAVTAKEADRFTVQELGDGSSDAEFDWVVVANVPAELGASEPQVLPAIG